MQIYAKFEDIQSELQAQLRKAQSSVLICVAWINFRVYGPVLKELTDKGVTVRLIYDDNRNNEKTIDALPAAVHRYAIRSRVKSALMHDKFCVIDDEVLITGSFNWSNGALKSFENIVVISGNYELVNQFRHEFEDLLHFYNTRNFGHVFSKCKYCRSYCFNLGIFGAESGPQADSEVSIWSVCAKNKHVEFLETRYEQFLDKKLTSGASDERADDADKAAKLREFNQARREMNLWQEYFNKRHGTPVHAVGVFLPLNETEVYEFQEPEEFALTIFWKHMYYRKIIPSELQEHEGDVSHIFDHHHRR